MGFPKVRIKTNGTIEISIMDMIKIGVLVVAIVGQFFLLRESIHDNANRIETMRDIQLPSISSDISEIKTDITRIENRLNRAEIAIFPSVP